jgi:cytochrome c
MRVFRAAFVACAVVFTASLLLARVHPFGDASLYGSRTAHRLILEGSSIPPDVRGILVTKCADCHSSQVRLPLYDHVAGRFAPASWLMERDIVEARRHLNLSLWDTYSADEQQSLKGMIVQEVKARDMPPLQYRLTHLHAGITNADIVVLTRWTRARPLFDDGSTERAADKSDATRGAAVFEKRCTGCHSLEQNREGPKLGGVFGRTSGEAPGYAYSPALKKAHIVWNEASLDRWLADPDAFVPGNNMDFQLVNPQERRDLIRFLKEGAGK